MTPKINYFLFTYLVYWVVLHGKIATIIKSSNLSWLHCLGSGYDSALLYRCILVYWMSIPRTHFTLACISSTVSSTILIWFVVPGISSCTCWCLWRLNPLGISFHEFPLDPSRTPHKLLFGHKIIKGIFDQPFSFRPVQNGKDKVVQSAPLDLGKCAFYQSLLEEELNQRCLIVMEPK